MEFSKNDKLLKILFTVVLFLSFLAIGSFKLNEDPALNQDEMAFALGADNISQTGYDLCGSKFPLFPCALSEFPYRSTTISYYGSALFYKFYVPGTIFDIRIFSVLLGALAGVFSLLLFYRLFEKTKNGFAYAAILAIIFYFSPAFFTIQRFAAPYFILSVLLQMALFYYCHSG